MMIILYALFGLGVGWVINQASDHFPRFTKHHRNAAATAASLPPLALLQIISGKSDSPWVRLHAANELCSATFVIFLWLRLGSSWLFLPYLGAYIFLALVTIIDIKYRLVLNIMVYPAVMIVLLGQFLIAQNDALPVLLGGSFAFLIFYGTASIRPNGLGGGDIKLAALIGFIFGFPGVLFALLFGAVATGIFIAGIFITHRGGMQTQIAYAPFLCFGALAALMLNPVWTGSGVLF